ncbi:MAG: methionyl-tRNA formyltransferase [Polyangiaceae bacterium]
MASTARLRVAFFGLPLAALLLDRDGHDVVLASICRSDAVGLRRAKKRFAGRFLLKPDATRPAFVERVRSLEPDLIVSWFWTKRLPMDVIRAARHGGIGAHPSLLPRHRGPDPTYWAIASGDTETGVSVHRLEADYDTGDVLMVERLPIDPAWNAWQLARALDRPSLRALRRTVAAFASGAPPAPIPQDESKATQAPAPDDDACAIRWSEPTNRILLHIRALAPSPGAWTEIAGALVSILEARASRSYPEVLVPGESVTIEDRAVVRTGDGAIDLLRVEIDGQPATLSELRALLDSASIGAPGSG